MFVIEDSDDIYVCTYIGVRYLQGACIYIYIRNIPIIGQQKARYSLRLNYI